MASAIDTIKAILTKNNRMKKSEAESLLYTGFNSTVLAKYGLNAAEIKEILQLASTIPVSKYTQKSTYVDTTPNDVDIYSPKTSFTDTQTGQNFDKQMRHDLNMTYDKKSHVELYYDRYYSVYPDLELDNLCQYVFIVRPDLNIIKPNSKNKLVDITDYQINRGYAANSSPNKDQFMRYMNKYYNNILRHLTSELTVHNDFMPYLVGRTEALQIPDYGVKNYYIMQPFTGLTLPYASNALESMTGGGGTFDITFREDNEFKIHKLFQAWLHYIDGVTRNLFTPLDKYVANNIIDYATSVYCITCKADGETIIYWTKYTGAFPISNPNSDTSFNLRGSVNTRMTVQFAYFLAEAMDPMILTDFNQNAHVDSSEAGIKKRVKDSIPIYSGTKFSGYPKLSTITADLLNEYAVLGTGYGLVGSPFIYKDSNTKQYKLGWKNPYN